MFQPVRKTRSTAHVILTMMELIYHSIVRSVRKSHNNAFLAIATNILQAVIFVGAFYVMFSILGLRGAALRGDFLIYIMSGIFLYMTHSKALGAVVGSEGPASPMMQHAPMNTIISICSAALGALYIQVLSLAVILFVYHVAFTPLEVEHPFAAFGMLMLAWFTGAALGLVLLAIKPWFPTAVSIFSTIYQRANMIASGKMFVANTLPGFMLAMFDWNPLFHTIDQARGFAFLNYNPRYSDPMYALWVGLVLVMVGLMGEFYTRKHASISWSARR
ncbi:ABC transporter permease [Sulfitobacter donghicola]|uniref:ABC transporter permease n=1 Tax=Sulfitobacter donghicola DSW-25 = KCTC 12864 = JCM 14565 TaxID=1300350 RepID=A0A073IZ69_9RHOB|nr:ABC transporter permease [Sulfitobacter donghicola]KEJ90702.1 ABC transporter permease [Sulfitobacter donghicola DSW-25 = KCTC 12864 = JCM 14565]KIN67955.1 ABC transporter, permease protein [Sulfitobacter donghicola DSW-25 = KCTC 12864 = JCM 14565]